MPSTTSEHSTEHTSARTAIPSDDLATGGHPTRRRTLSFGASSMPTPAASCCPSAAWADACSRPTRSGPPTWAPAGSSTRQSCSVHPRGRMTAYWATWRASSTSWVRRGRCTCGVPPPPRTCGHAAGDSSGIRLCSSGPRAGCPITRPISGSSRSTTLAGSTTGAGSSSPGTPSPSSTPTAPAPSSTRGPWTTRPGRCTWVTPGVSRSRRPLSTFRTNTRFSPWVSPPKQPAERATGTAWSGHDWLVQVTGSPPRSSAT